MACFHVPSIKCPSCAGQGWSYPTGQRAKCGVCGSTAIDHTEAACERNRFHEQVRGMAKRLKEDGDAIRANDSN